MRLKFQQNKEPKVHAYRFMLSRYGRHLSILFENMVWSLTRNLLTKMYACLLLTSDEWYEKKHQQRSLEFNHANWSSLAKKLIEIAV